MIWETTVQKFSFNQWYEKLLYRSLVSTNDIGELLYRSLESTNDIGELLERSLVSTNDMRNYNTEV